MRCGEHEQHAQQHDMSSNAASLGVVYLHRRLLAHLRALHIEEVDIVRADVHDRPQQQPVRDLSMKPLVLI